MIIVEKEALKTWLINILEPLCDAEPAVLAKYIIALLKNKPDEELKSTCLDQLEVFLQTETASFVDLLFAALESKSYIPSEETHPPVSDEEKQTGGETVETKEQPAEEQPSIGDGEAKEEEEETIPSYKATKKTVKTDSEEKPQEDSNKHRKEENKSRRSRSRDRDRRRRPSRKIDRRNWKSRSRSPRNRSRSPRKRSPLTRSKRARSPQKNINSAQEYQPKRRCKDFDEKGFCVRGDACRYDHGNDPVVLENVGLPQPFIPSYPPPGYPAITVPPPPIRPPVEPYNPDIPGIDSRVKWNAPMFTPNVPPPPYIPRLPRKQNTNVVTVRTIDNNETLMKKFPSPSCTLELKKVPSNLNTITDLNNHFSKFGKIVNIQVAYEGNLDACLITFSNHAEANAAYKCTEPVFNNRFIKLFWHKGNNEEAKLGDGQTENGAFKPTIDKNKFSLNRVGNDYTPPTVVDRKAYAIAQLQKSQEILAQKATLEKKQQEKKQEAIKLRQGILKKKQQLLNKQLEEQRNLLTKLESKTLPPKEKNNVKDTLLKLNESVKSLTKELVSSTKPVIQPLPTKLSPEQIKRMLLDAELDLIKKEQTGGDTTILKMRTLELKREAVQKGLLPTGAKRGRGGKVPGKGRGFVLTTHTNLDKRPKCILVSGYESDEKKEVLKHFGTYGKISDVIVDDNTPSVILQFTSRKEAEQALKSGRNFGDRTLTLNWYSQPLPRHGESLGQIITDTEKDKEEVETIVIEEPEEEEEEEEEEERTWRR